MMRTMSSERARDGPRRRPAWERPRVEERAEEHGQESRLEELDLPAVAVPVLADVDVGDVERPEHEQEDRVREAGHDECSQRGAEPCPSEERLVRDAEPEEAGNLDRRSAARAEVLRESLEVGVRRQEPVVPDERQPLPHQDEEGDEVDDAEQARMRKRVSQ
jgi:hypothetical protein